MAQKIHETLVAFAAQFGFHLIGGGGKALMASMPTQRWKQVPVRWPSSRCILTLFTRSSALWCRCENGDGVAAQGRFHREKIAGVLVMGRVKGESHRLPRRRHQAVPAQLIGFSAQHVGFQF
jgi:hypothetical protein